MLKYRVDGNKKETIEEIIEYIDTHADWRYHYDEMLDECYEEIDICGYDYAPSVALYQVDEVAYRCGMNDYSSDLLSNIRAEIESFDVDDKDEFYGFEIECFEEEIDLSNAPKIEDFEFFTEFCQDCSCCILDDECRTMLECSELFYNRKKDLTNK